ncbi:MAG: M13 family metallopeptidase [Chitinophagaceae bacterium]
MKKTNACLLMLAAAVGFAACNNVADPKPAATERASFLDPASRDTTVKPGDNFWLYANGSWNKSAVIAGTESGIGSFTDLRKASRDAMRLLCQDAAKAGAAKGSVQQLVGDFYTSGLDSTKIEQLGFTPIKPWLDQVNGLQDSKQMMQWIAAQRSEGNGYLYNFGVNPDDKNASFMICGFSQGGLGLPDRDYYFKTDAPTVDTRAKYAAYITTLFKLTGDDSATAAKNAASVIALETMIAGGHSTNIELRDPQKNYNKLAQADMAKLAPAIDWKTTFEGLQMKQDSFLVGQPKFFQTLGMLVNKVPVADWKTYLRFHVISDAAEFLSGAFANAHFDFYNKTLDGQQVQRSRDERIASQIDLTMGENLGQLYVKKYFDEAAKKRMLDLVNNMQQVYAKRIKELDWMSDETKTKALDKLNAFAKKIGFPDKWKDYKVDIDKNDYTGNMERLSKWAYADNIAKQGKPVDKSEWGMTPPTINAYYNPPFNEIVFPAGILQFPFFDPKADDAINYGGIGMVIGHEMTHGFDDQGAQYDKDGNLKNWWAASDNEKFKGKVNQVIKQYDEFTVLDSLHVKGALTVGENLADIGGIAIAYEAFKNTEQGKKNETIDGLTADQRFFLSFAQIWRTKLKDESVRQRIQGDPHSPAMWRVNGPLMNFTPWYNAFGVKEGDKMFKPEADRIKVW